MKVAVVCATRGLGRQVAYGISVAWSLKFGEWGGRSRKVWKVSWVQRHLGGEVVVA